jgi:hypothetical protein
MILGPGGGTVSDAPCAATNVIQFVLSQLSGAVATCVVSTSVTQTAGLEAG